MIHKQNGGIKTGLVRRRAFNIGLLSRLLNDVLSLTPNLSVGCRGSCASLQNRFNGLTLGADPKLLKQLKPRPSHSNTSMNRGVNEPLRHYAYQVPLIQYSILSVAADHVENHLEDEPLGLRVRHIAKGG